MMERTSSEKTTTQRAERTDRQDTTSGQDAVSIFRPDYGIEFVDSAAPGDGPVQRATRPAAARAGAAALPPNDTGLPDSVKAGVEAFSGTSLDGVKVHYNSARPAQLRAKAFTQGTDIHVAPGQERHVPHHHPQHRRRVVRVGSRAQRAVRPDHLDPRAAAQVDRLSQRRHVARHPRLRHRVNQRLITRRLSLERAVQHRPHVVRLQHCWPPTDVICLRVRHHDEVDPPVVERQLPPQRT